MRIPKSARSVVTCHASSPVGIGRQREDRRAWHVLWQARTAYAWIQPNATGQHRECNGMQQRRLHDLGERDRTALRTAAAPSPVDVMHGPLSRTQEVRVEHLLDAGFD